VCGVPKSNRQESGWEGEIRLLGNIKSSPSLRLLAINYRMVSKTVCLIQKSVAAPVHLHIHPFAIHPPSHTASLIPSGHPLSTRPPAHHLSTHHPPTQFTN
jgi:hypothetical protein